MTSILHCHDVLQKPIVLEGLPFLNEDGRRSRLPLKTAEMMIKHRVGPAMQTAGGLIRFRTDSPEIGVRVLLDEYNSHKNKGMSSGFDLYCGCAPEMKFLGSHCIMDAVENYEFSWKIKKSGMNDYSIYLPALCSFLKIEIGIAEGSSLEAPTPHRHKKGIAFYGSSITNCRAASRPGMLYPAIIGRMMDLVEFLDGKTFFAGDAREECSEDCCHQNDLGERLMADCIADRLKRMLAE